MRALIIYISLILLYPALVYAQYDLSILYEKSGNSYEVSIPPDRETSIVKIWTNNGNWIENISTEETLYTLTNNETVTFSKLGYYFAICNPYNREGSFFKLFNSKGENLGDWSSSEMGTPSFSYFDISDLDGTIIFVNQTSGRIQILNPNDKSSYYIENNRNNIGYISFQIYTCLAQKDSRLFIVMHEPFKKTDNNSVIRLFDYKTKEILWENYFVDTIKDDEEKVISISAHFSPSSRNLFVTLWYDTYHYNKPNYEAVRSYLLNANGIIKSEYLGLMPTTNQHVIFGVNEQKIFIESLFGYYRGEYVINISDGKINKSGND